MFKGKRLSILGDSVSTYKGISNDQSAHPTLWNNPWFYCGEFLPEKTYWMRLIKELGFELCVNNSWSGGNLSGQEDLNAGVNRVSYLARGDGSVPDFIIVFMGLNDLGRNVNVDTFATDYEKTLEKIKELYPEATTCCVNLPDRDAYFRSRTELFNGAIVKAVKNAGDSFFVADLFNSRLNNDFYYMNTVDGLHPDEDGMKIIAEVIKKAIITRK